MSQPYIGEVRTFGFSFAPVSYVFCNGQALPISQYTALFSIIGTTYGGDGQTTFNVPNMQGNAPMHWGNGQGLSPRTLGEPSGTTQVTLTIQQIPMHTHLVASADTMAPAQMTGMPTSSAYVGPSSPANAYDPTNQPSSNFSPKMITNAGSSLPHDNIQPLLTINFCIAVFGVFPPHS